MLGPDPKFEKRVHHIVPQSWQRRFFPVDPATNERATTGYYLDLSSNRMLGPLGPGMRMSEDYGYIVFDEYFRPSDQLEDRISQIESQAIPALDRVTASHSITPGDRIDISVLLALQALRYPSWFRDRFDRVRELVIALGEAQNFSDASTFNDWVRNNGLPGGEISEENFRELVEAPDTRRGVTINAYLQGHGYEPLLNGNDLIDALEPVARHIMALGWDLVEASSPEFILSDMPMPAENLGYDFNVSLTDTLALRASYPSVPVTHNTIVRARAANADDVDVVNADMQSRAVRFLCGPEAALKKLSAVQSQTP